VTLQLALAVTLLLGLPLLLLAIGVLAHAYVLARPRGRSVTEGHVEAMVAASVEQLLVQLRSAPPQGAPSLEGAPASLWTAAAPVEFVPARVSVPLAGAITPSGANLAQAVAQLVNEGLSDRSIARRLSVGIDEVRIARAAQGGGR
jgi:hypothetical protein